MNNELLTYQQQFDIQSKVIFKKACLIFSQQQKVKDELRNLTEDNANILGLTIKDFKTKELNELFFYFAGSQNKDPLDLACEMVLNTLEIEEFKLLRNLMEEEMC